MGSGFFKNLFSSNHNKSRNATLKGKSGAYESTVAQEPPVRGSYPVAGNGPNVEETLQQARLKREAKLNEARKSSLIGNVATRNPSGLPQSTAEPQIQRPQTAPNDGSPAVGFDNGRTRSGFSMKSPPSIFRSRRDSLRSLRSPPPVEPLPPIPPQHRQVQTYQPSKGPTPAAPSEPVSPSTATPQATTFVPPFAEKQHTRNFSHNSHVDLLDAYSSIRGPDATKQRTKAAGVRIYGEDVADRNIADFGDKELQKLDLNSPQFAYLKSLYAGKKRQVNEEGLGTKNASDDMKHNMASPQARSSTVPRPERISMTQRDVHGKGEDDQNAYVTTPTLRHGAFSPQSSRKEGSTSHNPRPESIDFSLLPRGRQVLGHNPPPVASPPQRVTSLGQSQLKAPNVPQSKRSSSAQQAPRVTSPIHSRSSSINKTTQNQGRPISRTGSVTYSAFPVIHTRDNSASDHHSHQTPRSMANSSKRMYLTEGAEQPPKLDGIVDLKNTVDTDVTTKTAPAVTHEFVQPTKHEHRQEKITREIHTHDVFHRVQPIIETEILPARHYIHAPDGRSLIEVPEDQIPGRTGEGAASKNWKIVQTPLGHNDYDNRTASFQQRRQDSYDLSYIPPQTIANDAGNIDDAAEPPVIGLVRSEAPSVKSRSRGSSRSSMHTPKSSRTRNILEPILASKRESLSPEGFSRKEYLWRHHPQLENFSRPSSSRSNPVYVGAGTGDLSSEGAAAIREAESRDFWYSDHSDHDDEYTIDTSKHGKPRDGEDVLFRDSGYGGAGGLPGISEDGHNASHRLVGDFSRMKIDNKPRRGGAIEDDAIVEREGEEETADDAGDEGSMNEDDRQRVSRRHIREVKPKRSSSDLRRAASKQGNNVRV